MSTPQNKANANVLDYNLPYRPESRRERWLFALAIGVFLILGVGQLLFWIDYYAAYRLMTSLKPMTYKAGLAIAYLMTPIGIGLAVFGLYNRTSYGYWLTGVCIGVILLLLSVFIYVVTFLAGDEVFSLPEVLLLEFGLPILIAGYLLFFLTRRPIMERCEVQKHSLLFSILCGYVAAGVIMALIWS